MLQVFIIKLDSVVELLIHIKKSVEQKRFIGTHSWQVNGHWHLVQMLGLAAAAVILLIFIIPR